MRPPPDYSPPDAPIRKRIPIGVPGDFGTHDTADRRVVSMLALVLVTLFIAAAILLSVVTQ